MEIESLSLPEDVIIEILVRLPVKSLICFKCTNKGWRDLISATDFATRHLEFNKNKPFSYIRMSKVRMQLFSNGEHAAYLRRSFMKDPKKYGRLSDGGYIVGSSSNGLVCFYCIRDRIFTIWNPATGDFRRFSGGGKLVGFDVRPCGDFRVVVISCFTGDIVIKMQSRSSKRWKKISKGNMAIEALVIDRSPEVVTLDGCMYWRILGSYDVQGKWLRNVACFDMWEAKYRTISGPPWRRQSGRLGVVNGSSLGFFFSAEVDNTLTVWVMNGQDGSWTKRYSVVPFKPQRFKSMRGEEVDIVMLDRELHFYHHATKKFWSFANLSEHLDVVQYKEALFSVYKPKM